MSLVIAAEPPEQAELAPLFAASDAFSAAHYPPESNHTVPPATLSGPSARFLVARQDGAPVACGGLLLLASSAEVKRMFVADAARGHGVGRALLEALEALARDAGCHLLRLETGVTSAAALRLYRTAGYVERDVFGEYGPDPLSVFMEKRLA